MFTFFLIFIGLFSNDAVVLGFPLFGVFLLLSFSLILLVDEPLGFNFYKIILLSFTAPVFLYQGVCLGFFEHYFVWFFQAFLLYATYKQIIFKVSFYQNSSFVNGQLFSCLFLLFLFVGGVIFFSAGSRGSFIFGSNVLYRIFSILTIWAIFLLGLTITKKRHYAISLAFVITIYLVGVLSTGSRGAIFSILVVLFCLYHQYVIKLSTRKIFFLGFLSFVIFGLLFYYMSDWFFNSRFSNFDYENNLSLALRLNPWVDFISNPIHFILSFGMPYSEFMGQYGHSQFGYPHNIFLELVFFYGFFGFLLFVFLMMLLFSSIKKLFTKPFCLGSVFLYCFMIVFLGAQTSGSLLDNFSCFSLLIMSLVCFDREVVEHKL